MSVFNKRPQALLLLKKNALQVYSGHDFEVLELEFPVSVVANLQVLEPLRYQELIYEALSSSDLRSQTALLLLSDEIIFQENRSFSSPEQLDREVVQFLETLPLLPEEVATVRIETQGQLYIFATNKHLFMPVVAEFENQGWQIASVSPALFYGEFGSKEVLEEGEVKQTIKEYSTSAHIDFLHTEKRSFTPEPNQTMVRRGWIINLVLVLLCGAAFLGALWTIPTVRPRLVAFFARSSPSHVPTSNGASPSPSPSSIPLAGKEELTIQVLNGSGISGQAGKVKAALVTLGYSNIDTGNTSLTTTGSQVAFSTRVAETDRQAIVEGLQKLFSVVTPITDPQATKDVAITTSK
ncbi:hypothetical protein A2631_03190 [Candidatus Daviesbacteria bacterium RIFCSPHIGHO2_01_FULL_44_29]|uniref:LytR/CpsA/Psr regulator C-terminal domain-containing protein n=1 Tax=Candidatus Daviesbacteria bacterium RIFCSPHIGHO2_02_FULL_43_12 TaxID=1797776 RepID=A0A1F5KKN4_9BACT|nr:MAG: hypothetical protein A2631_03190 [Candidatus Daviesbacteria bacterium RIFCSPHIGHO2_01_FULL_44_29]OGE41389.1 MAG: hypothetical protein A3D25_02585 [Candidatus Daviesbacteria bacterium RIFCSPHIGHO2_02_FULL_43_12]OGE69590.1 MAG: hypothetical protein A3B55_04330 [Candidatus Daviesbacteria bacterium RIFCSPLOWO2_01_FULL_43_15]